MKLDLYTAFKEELFKSVNAAQKRISSESGKNMKLRIVLQGSYVPGYSSNPRKGDRYIPNYLFDPSKKSDFDFRVYGDGLDEYVKYLRDNGKEIEDRGKDQEHLIQPESITVVITEFAGL
eukprot:389825_1